MNELMTTLAGTAETILTGLLALLTVYATRWIGAATARARAANDQIEDAQFRDFANEALDRVDDLATKTVARIEQTTAKAMRELIKAGSGPYTEADLKALGQRAVEEIISSLSPDYKDAIVRTVGSLERYVTSTVEISLYQRADHMVREICRLRKKHSPPSSTEMASCRKVLKSMPRLLYLLAGSSVMYEVLFSSSTFVYLDYLHESGYIEFSSKRITAYNAYAKDAVVKLTRKGTDLVEQTIEDEGVYI